MLDLWLKILEIMDRLMNSGQGDNLEEAVPESMKNILLVMVDGGYLVPPEAGEEPSALWTETTKRVDHFLPGLVKELFPQAPDVQVLSPTRAKAEGKVSKEATPRGSVEVRGENRVEETPPKKETSGADID